MTASGLTQFRPGDAEEALAAYGHHPTPTLSAVHTYLASLPRQPFDEELKRDTCQTLSCIRNLQWHMQQMRSLEDWGLGLMQFDKPREHQDASSLQLAAQRLADEMLSRSSLTRNLLSTLPPGKDKA